ncbi:hypothetical protein H4R33_003228 [Dimargaris cristalligena]|nr:hypothetical protein H4R33_003228 [Dimargaris cristalligena]
MSAPFKTQVEAHDSNGNPVYPNEPNQPHQQRDNQPKDGLSQDALLQSLQQKTSFDKDRILSTADMLQNVPLEADKAKQGKPAS